MGLLESRAISEKSYKKMQDFPVVEIHMKITGILPRINPKVECYELSIAGLDARKSTHR